MEAWPAAFPDDTPQDLAGEAFPYATKHAIDSRVGGKLFESKEVTSQVFDIADDRGVGGGLPDRATMVGRGVDRPVIIGDHADSRNAQHLLDLVTGESLEHRVIPIDDNPERVRHAVFRQCFPKKLEPRTDETV